MAGKIIKYIKGFVRIQIKGNNLERYINVCSHNNIDMFDVCYDKEYIEMRISVTDFKKLKSIIRKTNVHIKIEERYGLPFFLFKNRKRKVFLAGIISAFVLVYVMSLYIWQISFEGNYSHTAEELLKFLSEEGVECGIKKNNLKGENIEKILRNEYDDIKWVSVEIIGTKMIVHIKENFNEVVEENVDDNYSIIAEKDATIVSIVTGSGTPMVKALDEVKKGDVLISGHYDIKSDYDELIETRLVQAEGTILASTVYTMNEKIDRNYTEKVYTSNVCERYIFNIFGKTINIDWFVKEYELSDKREDIKQVVIGDSFYLPMYKTTSEYREYVVKEKYYSDEEAYTLGQKNIDIFLQKLAEKGIQITQNNVKIEVNEKSIIISGEIRCLEYIGEKRID